MNDTVNDEMNDTTDGAARDAHADACPRCGARLRAWGELGEEEREVARRLPASANFSTEERTRRHRFCVRCWYEETASEPRTT